VTHRGARVYADGLGFAYSGADSWALAHIAIDIAPGEELWLTGANASGKSTLLGLLANVIPTVIEGTLAGELEVTAERGAATAPATAATAAAAETAAPAVPDAINSMVMQDSGVYLFRTVYDEIAFVLANRGVAPELVPAAVADALAVLGVESLEGRLMHTLSGGERQKVAVCAALAVEPDLLLLDEPFEQLDPASVAEVFSAARSLAEEGLTLVIATRQASLVPPGARELHLAAGRLAERPAAAPAPEPRAPGIPGEPLLELAGVTHRYSPTAGIEGVDLTVRRGESVALLGPNGAGKTTLMKHADGLLRPQSGIVRVAGADIAERPVHQIAREVGMLFQNPDDQIFNRTVISEVAWAPRARGMAEPEAHAVALEALAELGIEHLSAENPHELTASQRQLVAFASILVVSPQLYVLDEPTKALDAAAAEKVAVAVDRRLAEGAGVLLVTHDLAFAERLADRSVVLIGGSVAWEGMTAALLDEREVLERARLLEAPLVAKRSATPSAVQ